MVTNLPPQAKAKWAEAIATKDPAAKLRLLREFYSSFPKHKSTERLQMMLKRQINSLEDEIERARTRRAGSTRLEWVVRKEGFVQLALVGALAPSTELFNLLTRQKVEPYQALMRPLVGILEGGGVQFQIILSPYDERLSDGRLEHFMNIARNADAVLLAQDPEAQGYSKRIAGWFQEHGIDALSEEQRVEIEHTHAGGVRVVGSSGLVGEGEIKEFLKGYGLKNALLKVSKKATLDDVESAIFGRVYKRVLPVVNEASERSPSDNVLKFDGSKVEDLVLQLLQRLDLMRIFTKSTGGGLAEKPLVVRKGSRVVDAAEMIHRDLVSNFRYAKVWRASKHHGVRVGKGYLLSDGDVVEIHSS